jgi:hypothetical protein
MHRRNVARLVASFALFCALAACATIPQSLPSDQIRSLKLTAVNVTIAPDASIQWADGLHAWAKQKGIPDHELARAGDSDEARAYARTLLAGKVRETTMRVLSLSLAGTRPARINVVVKGFVIASAAQRVIIGGSHVMSADVTLVDAGGRELLARPNFVVVNAAGQGVVGALVDAAMLPDPTQRLLEDFANRYRDWLLPPA